VPSWQQAFWLEALLLADPSAAAEEVTWLTLLHAPPVGQSDLTLDLLLAAFGSGSTG
jgi:hypothetical protein